MTLTRINGIFCSTDREGVSEEISMDEVVQIMTRNAFSLALDGELVGQDLTDLLEQEWGNVELSDDDHKELALSYMNHMVDTFKRCASHITKIKPGTTIKISVCRKLN